jgi:transcriptional regulator with XRE-family HTH domain
MAKRNDKVLLQLAKRVRELRKARGLTQIAVLEDTGINIGNMETRPINLTITSIVTLCDYFEVSLEEFFRGIGNQYTI